MADKAVCGGSASGMRSVAVVVVSGQGVVTARSTSFSPMGLTVIGAA